MSQTDGDDAGGAGGDATPREITFRDALWHQQRQLPRMSVPPVSECPKARLSTWRIYEAGGSGERRLAGHCVDLDTWRTSSPIVAFRVGDMRVRTASGREYALLGEPDEPGGAADGVWGQWLLRHRVETSHDVTEEAILEALSGLIRRTVAELDASRERSRALERDAARRTAEVRQAVIQELSDHPEVLERLRTLFPPEG